MQKHNSLFFSISLDKSQIVILGLWIILQYIYDSNIALILHFYAYALTTLICFPGFAFSSKLTVDIKHGRPGRHIWVICSADVVPHGRTAEFLVNGVTEDIIRRHNSSCFSAITRSPCLSNACNCSDDGKIYSSKIYFDRGIENVNLTCSMTFKMNKEVSQTKNINIKSYGKDSNSKTCFKIHIGSSKYTTII